MKYIGENAIKKLISLIKGDLATKQPTITASGILKGDGSGTVTAADTQEATLVDVPNGLLKGDGTTISAAVAGTDYIDPENTKDVELVDVVSYNPETRTDTQKKQARGNIGAAPDGYGLGAATVTLTASDDLDNVSGNGWYYWGSSVPANTPTLINAESTPAWCSMLVIDSTQIVCSSNDRNNVAMRTKNNAGWTPWEYVNPALKLGVEYRTTERYLSKPVYKKLLSFTGAMTEGYSDMDHNIANIAAIVGCYTELFAGATTLSTPILDGSAQIIFSAGLTAIRKTSVGNFSAYSARVLLSYTKTTD